MMFPLGRGLGWCALLLLFAAGCIPTRDTSQDEQREPHFLHGQELRKAGEFRNSAAAFEKALEANPRSAFAHFELGLLYEQPLNDPATAIYHFERFLKMRPASDRAELVRQRSNNCKLELARLFLIAPGAPSVQKELDKLKTEVERLGLENHQLRRQVEVLSAQAPSRGSNAPASALAGASPTRPSTPPAAHLPPSPPPTPTVPPPSAKAAPARTHVVKSGDTPATIARQHNVKLEALQAVNPGLDPKRLKIGQSLAVPAP